jgi:hypothetical protein
MHNVAKATLNMVLESAEYGEAGERVTYGNLAGRELLKEKNEMREMFKTFESKIEKLEKRDADKEFQIADLQDRVKTLTLASDGYRKIRHRFLEVYRRDILDGINRQGYMKIGEGNEAAHNGDAIADAYLYTSGERHDEKVLVDLYGLTSLQISSNLSSR